MTRRFQFSLGRLLVAMPVFATASLFAAQFVHCRPDPHGVREMWLSCAFILGGAGIGVLFDKAALRGLLFGALAGWFVPLLLLLLSLLLPVTRD